MKVIGYNHKAGTFKDKQTNADVVYDNWELHCVCSTAENPEGFGEGNAVTIIKVKAVDYAASCNRAGIPSPVNLEISPIYQVSGRFVKCTGFNVVGKAR